MCFLSVYELEQKFPKVVSLRTSERMKYTTRAVIYRPAHYEISHHEMCLYITVHNYMTVVQFLPLVTHVRANVGIIIKDQFNVNSYNARLPTSSLGLNSSGAEAVLKKSSLCSPPVQLYKMVSGYIHVLYGKLLDTGRYTYS